MVPKQMTRTFTVLVPHQENYNVNVTKYRNVPYQQQVTTMCPKWVDEPRQITVCRTVPEQQTIQVARCEAYQEQVMMSRTVDRGCWQTEGSSRSTTIAAITAARKRVAAGSGCRTASPSSIPAWSRSTALSTFRCQITVCRRSKTQQTITCKKCVHGAGRVQRHLLPL